MGGKPSIHIQTPEFREDEWQYQPSNIVYPEYGIYRTLSHKKTGELIDQYTLNWINEEEYSYYLRSFNWRYNQPNVVNTRFIVQKSQRQFCAQTFSAKIYVEHVLSRLSEIKDVPYPDNLFLLMESLEGYGRIYVHSKYFLIEESQICVDAEGNIKVWVNADLSINYPFSEQRAYGEQEMVERLIHIVAENTDRDTEPSETFLEFFEERKGQRGKKFEEAKVLVLEYAKANNETIPSRFESIFNLDKEDEYTEPEEQEAIHDSSQHYQHNWQGPPRDDQSNVFKHPTFGKHQSAESFQPGFPPMYAQPQSFQQPIRMSQPVNFVHNQPLYPRQQQPYFMPPYQNHQYFVQYPQYPPFNHYQIPLQPLPQQPVVIPTYQRVEVPLRQSNQAITPVLMQPPTLSVAPATAQPEPEQKIATNSGRAADIQPSEKIRISNGYKMEGSQERKLQIQDLDSPVDIRVTFNKNVQRQIHYKGPPEKEKAQYHYNQSFQETSQQHAHMEESGTNKVASHYRNNSHQQGNSNSMSEADDMVARSLPIKAGQPAQPNQQLSSFGQSDRSAYSHINTRDQWHANTDGFGLTEQRNVSQPKNKAAGSLIGKAQSRGGKNQAKGRKGQAKAVKYYFSLSEELQIDPDIAADLAKYLS